MNTIAHNVVAKLSVAFVAVAMLFTMVSPAKAATAEEMQQMINSLLAQVAALQGQMGGSSSAAGMCPYTWTRSLKTGDTGMDVMKLQQFLNSDADTRVSASGVGSAGMETEYFGPATAAAVSKMQVKYRSDILSPAGLVNPTGFFGPSTMAKANALCVGGSVVVPPVVDDSSDDSSDDSDDDMSSGELGGEAALKSFDIEDGDDTDLEEGQTKESVQEFIVEFEDGDAMISRLDVEFVAASGDDIWDILGEVTLFVDGDDVASIDGSDEDNWRDDEKTLRFNGLDIVAMEDDELTITLGVEVQDNLDTDTDTVDVDVTGMRFVDGDDVTSTLDADDVGAAAGQFEIAPAGDADELIVKSATNDPEATTLIVDDETTKSDWYTVFMFDLDTDDSINDIELNNVGVEVTLTNGSDNVNAVVQDAELVIDGESYDDWDWASVNGQVMGIDFDIDGDHVIDAGDRVTAELKLRFYGVGSGVDEGQTFQVVASTTLFDAEGVENVDAEGAATSEEHTLRSAGLTADAGSVETDEDTQGTADDTGIFTLSFEVTALEGDFYVKDAANLVGAGATTTLGGIFFKVDGPAAPTSATGVLTSTGDEENPGVFTVREGETETFTLTVTVNAATAGQHRLVAEALVFSPTNTGIGSGVDTLELLPATDYRTAYININ